MSEALFRVEKLTRRYSDPGREVLGLDQVDLSLAKGGRLGIVGESGSGKSTLVRLLAGLDRPTSGRIWYEGTEITGLPERRLGFLRASVQMVFQDPRSSLNPRMRVGDIITEPLRSRLVRRQLSAEVDHGARLAEVLAAVDLPADAAGRFPHEFSGGQRQRIAIARALAPKPEVLIADEPVSALDVSVRAQVLNLLTELVADQGLTLIVVSHDLMVVRHLCDQLAVMRAGRIVEQGATSDVYSAPKTDYTAALLAAVPKIRTGAGRGDSEPPGRFGEPKSGREGAHQ
ncbi:ABC transporter ATP-binding protein [Propionicimonas sp.]|uniref:ABC transporter ATP-binding protein n=1 Tax=Propionicimonas sp. TaxID=1955623 RepID=UPI0017FCE2D5|nr:ABC transporter ATP-binding protein [Propionicimonas sp.]MBU3977489.1 ATP-binding cassette domain-containing protein [Actinomycetota bacterium]MBA3021414.1 ABC transporter ATP-binding protein [Propionicimonas sp.]MBU3985999.1 ATP-binding cassette domain-containing protein [Actinomycetota bacterium]MBU4008784.1 ATP-binding cassette domain-containing protein [Actinomycetota bacterium]MBU4066066.1 ATP-binding cassette domain-containing protein [Actinomycetota bacterium]